MRRASLIVAVGFIAFCLIELRPPSLKAAAGSALFLSICVLLPLACIWYGDEMGDYVGTLPGPAINKPTPGGLVKAGGWVLLLMPIVVWFFLLKD